MSPELQLKLCRVVLDDETLSAAEKLRTLRRMAAPSFLYTVGTTRDLAEVRKPLTRVTRRGVDPREQPEFVQSADAPPPPVAGAARLT